MIGRGGGSLFYLKTNEPLFLVFDGFKWIRPLYQNWAINWKILNCGQLPKGHFWKLESFKVRAWMPFISTNDGWISRTAPWKLPQLKQNHSINL